MSIKSPQSREDERDEPRARTRAKSEIEERARHLAQMSGGEVEEWIEKIKQSEPFDASKIVDAGWNKVAEYEYATAESEPLYKVIRFQHFKVKSEKRFIQIYFDYRDDRKGWRWGAGSIKVPYLWPRLARANPDATIFITEGEKDADRLTALDLIATTVAGQNWSDTAANAFAGRKVIVIPDNDETGRENAAVAVEQLTGIAGEIRVLRLPGLRYKGDISEWFDAGGTKDRLLELAATAPRQGLHARAHDFPDEEKIPTWDFLYGKHLLRGTVSGTAAMGGSGKSSLSIGEGLCMASGKQFLGVAVRQGLGPLRVMLINLEDDRATMNKRIAAAMRYHGLSRDDIGDRLFVVAKGEATLKVASQSRQGALIRHQKVVDQLIRMARDNRVDVLSIDPFVRVHSINENSNSLIQEVVECFEEIAHEANCAVSLWHHTRKPNGIEASADSARGASSFVDACRSIRVLEGMSKEEANQLKLEHHRNYFRSFSGKLNFAPPAADSTWYKFTNVELNNGGGLFGDDVGVVTHWEHPGRKDIDLSAEDIAQIKKAVAAGTWREDPRADMWVGKAVASVLHLTEKARVQSALKKLMESGVLKVEPGRDEKRMLRMFVVVAPPADAPQSEVAAPADVAPAA
jgi:hypothetical protein